jgi:HSP20 family protein
MSMVRWDPFRTLMRWPSIWDDEDYLTSSSTPSQLDVYETESDVVVKANVAGVDDDKVDITFEKGVLTISAEEIEESPEGKKYYQKASRSYSYRVAVPGNIDSKVDPEAEIKKGVVTIRFAKADEAKPKKIAIKTK